MQALYLAQMIKENRGIKTVENNAEILNEIASGHANKGKTGVLQESCLGFFL